MTIPVFKSHYSIGKSILTLQSPSKTQEGSADSIIDIALDAGLKEVVLIEDTMHGFLEAKKRCDENNLQLIFGIRINVCSSYPTDKDDKVKSHKAIVMAKNDDGVKKLYKIYSYVHCDQESMITKEDLKKHWSKSDLALVIPFYDSFLHHNSFKYNTNFQDDFSYFEPVFFIENNNLPIDLLLKNKVESFVKKFKFNTQKVKSIYYRNRKDLVAFQTYKMITNRSFSKKASISAPNLEGCGSDEFCMESWLEL